MVYTLFLGGIVTASCPHGVVYAVKSLLRGESVRDHVDILLSFRHMPNLTINDMPGMTARHGNYRHPGLFSPHEGRLAEPTPANQDLWKQGKLWVSLPFLKRGTDLPLNSTKGAAEADHSYCSSGHPSTGIADHYVAVDNLHLKNIKTEDDFMRDLKIVRELKGQINSIVAEQLFSGLKKDLYFLNQFGPANYLFILRLLLHLKSDDIINHQKKKTEELIKSSFGKCVIGIGSDGRLGIVSNLDNNQSSETNIPSTDAGSDDQEDLINVAHSSTPTATAPVDLSDTGLNPEGKLANSFIVTCPLFYNPLY